MEAIWNDGRRFAGRVALVTGAGGTLGGAVAAGFGREGASVVVGYRSSREAAESVVHEIVGAGGAAFAAQLDVTDQASVDRFVELADSTYGRSSTYGNGVTPENPINWVPVTYCAAKGAIRGFTAALARDIAPEIRVNALAPGPISGNWEEGWGVAQEHVDEAKAMNPLKRFGDPREIAETVLFLASDGAGYINGQVLHVEGGWVPAG